MRCIDGGARALLSAQRDEFAVVDDAVLHAIQRYAGNGRYRVVSRTHNRGRLMKARADLGLPLIHAGSIDMIPEERRAAYEAAFIETAKEVGMLFLAAGDIPRPDTRYQSYNEGNLFRVSVPSNWRELSSNNNVTFAPEGAYGSMNGNRNNAHSGSQMYQASKRLPK